MIYSREMLCCCEDATALAATILKIKLSEVLLLGIHSFLYLNGAGGTIKTSVIAWALRATIAFDEPEYN